MEFVRTPDDRFEELTGYPYDPRYVQVGQDGLRMHYVARGPKDAPPILMLHGEPTWSYLYRHMIPIFAEAHWRPVAPDLIGFGRSDKPTARSAYTIESHLRWLKSFVDHLGLDRITLVGQDWGGMLGLRLLAENPERFERAVLANTFLPTGADPGKPGPTPSLVGETPEPTGAEDLGPAFYAWRDLSQRVEDLDCGRVVQRGTTTKLSPEVEYAYNAPFPDRSYKAGALAFPMLVPTSVDAPGAAENRQAWTVLENLELPILCAFSDRDPVTRGAEPVLRERLRGAQGQPHTTIEGAGHFLQEDRGSELAHVVLDFLSGGSM